MKEQTIIDLSIYLGELMQQIETTFDYFEKQKLLKKKKSIEILLNIDIL